jgi:hypothetical protein
MSNNNVVRTAYDYQERTGDNDVNDIHAYCEELETEAKKAEHLEFLDLKLDLQFEEIKKLAKIVGKAKIQEMTDKAITNYKQNIRRANVKFA